MWDSASTVEALMTEEAYERWVSIAPEVFEEFVPFDEPENLEGVDEEGGAQLVGTSKIKLQLLPGRVGEMEVSVLRNGTTGSADILIGSRVQRAERWHGSTDIGRDIIKLRRPPDGLGRVKIPIQWKLWDKTEKEHARTMLMDKQQKKEVKELLEGVKYEGFWPKFGRRVVSMALAICAIATVTLAAHTTTHAPVKGCLASMWSLGCHLPTQREWQWTT